MGSSPILLHPLLPDDHEKEAELGKSPAAELQTEVTEDEQDGVTGLRECLA